MSCLIPPRIVQFFFSDSIPKSLSAQHRELTLKQRAFTANIRLLNPDSEWLFFNNADAELFIEREFPQFRDIFDSFPFPIQRYDFFRYLAIYRLGGFYFDLDVLLAKDLSGLRSSSCVFPFEGLTFSRLLRNYGMDWELGNYAFGAAPGHPFLKAVIDNCVRAQRDRAWVEEMMVGVPRLSRGAHQVLYSTGPGLVSRTLAENPALAATVTVLFPDDVCDVRSWNRFGDFGVHLMEGTWRPKTSFLRRKLTLRREASVTEKLLRASRRLGTTRSVRCGHNVDGDVQNGTTGTAPSTENVNHASSRR